MFSKYTLWLAVVPAVAGVAIFYLLGTTNTFYSSEPVSLHTSFGTILGRTGISRNGRLYNSFTKIPYARPPIGKLRFKAPVPLGKEGWKGTLDATSTAPDCMQIDPVLKLLNGQEDCLYLNVYTPKIPTDGSESNLLPVIVYIHGGHFMFGGTGMIGPQYFMDEDVVLVTINYRVGALGFLNSGDDVVPGNFGMKDQVKALEWVRDNIQFFGGQSSYTLMGHSAGGASVHLHMLSEMSKDVGIKSAVSMSGSSLCPWGFTMNPKDQAIQLGKRLGCPTENSKALLECLLAMRAEDIVETQRDKLDVFHAPSAIYGPSIENVKDKKSGFLNESPTELLRAGKFQKIPWITGISSAEVVFSNAESLSRLNEKWDEVIPNALILYNASSTATHQKIRKFYFGANDAKIGLQHIEELTNAYSDRYFILGVREAAIVHSAHAPTFLYYYNYEADFTLAPILVAMSSTSGPLPFFLRFFKEIVKMKVYNLMGWDYEKYGVCHGDDIIHMFQFLPFLSTSVDSEHFGFSRSLVRLWVDFAGLNAKVIEGLQFNGAQWNPMKMDSKNGAQRLQYFQIGIPTQMIEEPFTERIQFWKSLNVPNN